MRGGIVINYNLAAEYASLVILCIAMIGFFIEKDGVSVRYQGLKWMYYSTLVAIVITIASVTSVNLYASIPLIITNVLKMMYFFTAPLLALLYAYFSIAIIYNKYSLRKILKKYIWLSIPYALYLAIVATNPIHHLIYTISAEHGYIKGDFSQASYYIAFIYFAILVAFTFKHRKAPQKYVLLVICLNFALSACIFGLQIFFPLTQLSGLACVSGLLVVHLYILSISKTLDSLTELYNRHTLTFHLTEMCEYKKNHSLAVFSIRNFKSINERFGLEYGDELLADISLRLRTLLPTKKIYRYSGDEFAYLELNPTDDFNELLKDIADDISRPNTSEENHFSLDIIYARVDFPSFGNNAKEIVSALDYSISSIKKSVGEINFFYDSSICDEIKRRNHIIERLKYATENNGFDVHYQAIHSSKTNTFTMAEALVRLSPSVDAPISPSEFIPIAEETGLIGKLTFIVLEKVCQDYRYFLDKYGNSFSIQSISVNFPYVLFLRHDTVQKVTDILDRYCIKPAQIKMELTERTLVSDIATTKMLMKKFIEKGFEFELDDFGVEYSNLSLFFDIPIKIIKFDRSLVYSATSDNVRRTFFNHLLKAIKAMDLQVVMEGVEEEELLRFLHLNECDFIQGYVFTKPLPRDEFADFIKQ